MPAPSPPMASAWSRVDTKRIASPVGRQRAPSLLPGWPQVTQVWFDPSRFIVKSCDLPLTVSGTIASLLSGESVRPSAEGTFAPVTRSSRDWGAFCLSTV